MELSFFLYCSFKASQQGADTQGVIKEEIESNLETKENDTSTTEA